MAGPPPSPRSRPFGSKSQIMQLGDTIIVCGVEFVITEVNLQFNKPPVLTAKTPEELSPKDALLPDLGEGD